MCIQFVFGYSSLAQSMASSLCAPFGTQVLTLACFAALFLLSPVSADLISLSSFSSQQRPSKPTSTLNSFKIFWFCVLHVCFGQHILQELHVSQVLEGQRLTSPFIVFIEQPSINVETSQPHLSSPSILLHEKPPMTTQ